MRTLSPFAIFATLLGSVFIGSLFHDAFSNQNTCSYKTPASLDVSLSPQHDDAVQAKSIEGLWEKRAGDKIRFYYFHQGGVGLYRYGKVGFNYTNSYTYKVEEGEIVLTFNKTGQVHRVPFELNKGTMTLKKDPREFGKRVVYKKRMGPMNDQSISLWSNHVQGLAQNPVGPNAPLRPQGQMWIDAQRYTNGELRFQIYQFAIGAPDGRGAGWHHRGDFSDWSTEGFSYRFNPKDVTLRFDLTGEEHTSPYRLQSKGETTLFSLGDDPRNFWHRTDFKHMGKSF